jgi:hypothetical protein
MKIASENIKCVGVCLQRGSTSGILLGENIKDGQINV